MADETTAIAAVTGLSERLSALVSSPDDDAVNEIAAELERMSAGPTKEMGAATLRAVLHARGERAQYRQRERELQALIATARDLISFSDVDDVLRAIVERVRGLFLADSCYVALVDPGSGDAYMRTTSGTLSAAMESVRQRPGEGLGGEVISKGRALWTEDYFRDPAINRNPVVASAVEADGVRSIAGVPIKTGGTTIGALFIANRRPHRFSAPEMALLSSMGDQAAVALANARLFQEVERTAQSLREMNDSLSEQSAHLKRSSATHARLTSLALDRVSHQDFVRIVAGLLGAAVIYLTDEFGTVLARYAPRVAEKMLTALNVAAAEAAARMPTQTELLPVHDGDPRTERWLVPVRAGTSRLGYLYAVFSEPQSQIMVQSLEQSAQTAAILELLERQTFLVEQDLRGELIDDLLNPRGPSWDVIERRTHRSRLLDPYATHWVLVLAATGESTRKQLTEVCARLIAPIRGMASEYAGDVVVIVPSAAFGDPHEFIRRVRKNLRRVAPRAVVSGGLSGPVEQISDLQTTYADAARCLRIGLALRRSGEVITQKDLGALGLILEGTSRGRVEELLRAGLGPLLRYDEENGAMLVETLQAYFDASQNPRTAAGALFVHPNTIYQRLSRIDEVFGSNDWRTPAGSLEIQLALQFHQLLQHMPLEELLRESTRSSQGPAQAHGHSRRLHATQARLARA